jgi:ribosomal protein L4
MPKVDVYDINGKKVSDVELNENVFGIEPNEAIVHEVLVNYLANQRQGTQSTKTSRSSWWWKKAMETKRNRTCKTRKYPCTTMD